jgi:hypothetical protein
MRAIAIPCIFAALVGVARGFLPPCLEASRSWTLPRSVLGGVTSSAATTQGLVLGTAKGYVVHLHAYDDDRGKVLLAELTDGQSVLHVHASGPFVAGSFYDGATNHHVARTMDAEGAGHCWDVRHRTHVVGGGFCRLCMDLCHVSVSIDGHYAALSTRLGKVVQKGNLSDLVPGNPACVKVLDDGMVAVGTTSGRVALVDLVLRRVNSVASLDGVPSGIDAARVGTDEYVVAWTRADRRSVTTATTKRRVSQRRKASFSGMREEAVPVRGSIVGVDVASHGAPTATMHLDSGETVLGSFKVQGRVVPASFTNAMFVIRETFVALVHACPGTLANDDDNNDERPSDS